VDFRDILPIRVQAIAQRCVRKGLATLADEQPQSDDTQPAPDPQRFFRTDHLDSDLRGRAVRGGAVTLIGQVGGAVLSTASTIILARLLTPEDYGLIGMLGAFAGFIALFKDAGLTAATVQRRELTHQLVSNLFWLHIAIAVCEMLVVIAIAPLLVWLYDEPRLMLLALLTSPRNVISAMSLQHDALLRRQMRFKAMVMIQIIAQVVGLIVAIIMAVRGWGYWSLVGMSLSTAACITALTWLASGWRPSWFRRGAGVRESLRFGGFLTGASIANYTATNADNALIGLRWGADPLGLYTRAYTLLLLPIRQINAPLAAVAVPALSRLQDDPERLRRFYRQALSLLAFFTLPGVALMALLAEPIIHLALGDQWYQATPAFRLLAIGGLSMPLCYSQSWLFIALGLTKHHMINSIITATSLTGGFLIGLPFGVEGVAAAFAVVWLLLLPVYGGYIVAVTPVTWRDLIQAVLAPAVSAAVAISATWAVLHFGGVHSHWLSLIAGIAVMAVVYLAMMMLVFRRAGYYLSLTRTLRGLH
jgi:PST family polysaccharide transporter